MKIDKAGFTLIELLLSTLIFSILVLSIAASFHSGILSYDRIDASFDTYQTARLVLSRISRDLSNSFSYPIPKKDAVFSAGDRSIEFFTILDLFDEQGRSSLSVCRVIYEFDGDVLRRTLLKGIDALNPAVIAEKSEPVGADPCVCPLLKDISFEYAYSINDPANEKAFGWQDSWPKQDAPGQKEILPLAVRIKLCLTQKNRQGEDRTVEFNKLVSLN